MANEEHLELLRKGVDNWNVWRRTNEVLHPNLRGADLSRARLSGAIVGKLLGHSQAQTTARYAHLDADPLLRAVNLIGERIESAMNSPATTISGETRRS